jgi:hypothetical protein
MEPVPVPVATQTAHPWRAMIRTGVAVGLPAFAGLLVLLPAIIGELTSGPLAEYLPPGLIGWLLGLAGLITATSMAITRILAIPGVIEWCRRHLSFLAPDPGTGRRRAR